MDIIRDMAESVFPSIAIVLGLIAVGGIFVAAEIALISLRDSQVKQLSSKSKRGARVAKLTSNPNRFLAAVQVGITFCGFLSAAFGAEQLGVYVIPRLEELGFSPGTSEFLSILGITLVIVYISLVFGELVPKTIAMNNAEKIALVCAPIINYFTITTYPFVKLLSFSTKIILKITGIKENDNDHISEEELKFMLFNAGKHGVLETEESQVHQNLFYFADQTAKSLMTHNSEVEWINSNEPIDAILQQILKSNYSKFLVCDGQLNQVKGVITTKDFLENYQKEGFEIQSILEPTIYIIQNSPAFKILNLFKSKKQYIAAVIDEYGGVVGILTLHDLIEAIVGDLPEEDEVDELSIFQRTDGSYLIDGKTLIFELNQFFQKEIIALWTKG